MTEEKEVVRFDSGEPGALVDAVRTGTTHELRDALAAAAAICPTENNSDKWVCALITAGLLYVLRSGDEYAHSWAGVWDFLHSDKVFGRMPDCNDPRVKQFRMDMIKMEKDDPRSYSFLFYEAFYRLKGFANPMVKCV